jgi:hypothetical protein
MLAFKYNRDDQLIELVWIDEIYLGGQLLAVIARPN